MCIKEIGLRAQNLLNYSRCDWVIAPWTSPLDIHIGLRQVSNFLCKWTCMASPSTYANRPRFTLCKLELYFKVSNTNKQFRILHLLYMWRGYRHVVIGFKVRYVYASTSYSRMEFKSRPIACIYLCCSHISLGLKIILWMLSSASKWSTTFQFTYQSTKNMLLRT